MVLRPRKEGASAGVLSDFSALVLAGCSAAIVAAAIGRRGDEAFTATSTVVLNSEGRGDRARNEEPKQTHRDLKPQGAMHFLGLLTEPHGDSIPHAVSPTFQRNVPRA